MAQKILGTNPSNDKDMATKKYVDDAISTTASPITGFQSVTTAAGTTTLTSSSPMITQFTGSTTQTCVLPNATTLSVGRQFVLSNRSTGSVQVNANGGSAVQTLFSTSEAKLTLTANGSAAGTWDVTYLSTGGSVGVAATAYVSTQQSTSSSSYTNLTTTTDEVTVTIGSSGMAMVSISAEMTNDSSLGGARMGFALSGANTQAANDNQSIYYQVFTPTSQGAMGNTFLLTGLTAGSTVFKAKYRANYTGTASFTYRRISVVPINNTNLWAGQTNNLSGTYSSLPAAGVAGRMYVCTDVDSTYIDNGSSWSRIRFGDSGMTTAIGDVPTSGWTSGNMPSSSTWTQSLDGMLFSVPSQSGDNVAYQYRSYPGSPFTLTVYCESSLNQLWSIAGSSVCTGGLCISDGTKILFFGGGTGTLVSGNYPEAGYMVGGQYMNTVSSYNSTINSQWISASRYMSSTPKWWKFEDTGTNRIISFSTNGADWWQVISESRTNFLTPTRIGVYVNNYNTTKTGYLRVRSWSGVA